MPSDNPGQTSAPRTSRWWWVSKAWTLHLVSVTALTTLFFIATVTTPPDAGANIGAGLVLGFIGVLGLPWTIPVNVNPSYFQQWPYPVYLTLWITPAFLNVALHAATTARSRHRRLLGQH